MTTGQVAFIIVLALLVILFLSDPALLNHIIVALNSL